MTLLLPHLLTTIGAISPPDPTAGFNPLSLVQYGVLGLVIVALLTGQLWTKPAVERLIVDKERAETSRDELADLLQNKVFPILQAATSVTARAADVIEEANRVLDRAYESEARRPRPRHRTDLPEE